MVKKYFFDYDNLHILGGYKDKVHVKGLSQEWDETKEPKLEVGVAYNMSDFPEVTDEDIILSIDRNMFKDMLDKWLDEKINYCNHWNEYCGSGGYIYCETEKAYETWVNEYSNNPDENPVRKDYVVYNVISFDELIDMEHG
jgi:hypothetical protein